MSVGQAASPSWDMRVGREPTGVAWVRTHISLCREYTALTFAGAMKFEDGVRLVKIRGESMQAAADMKASGARARRGMLLYNAKHLACGA